MTKKQDVIITTLGMDGACSAALMLLKKTTSELSITTTNRFAKTLRDILDSEKKPKNIYIMGVGVEENILEIEELLSEIKKNNTEIIWFCGRGYLNRYKEILKKYSILKFKRFESNTEAVLDYLKQDKIDIGISEHLCSLALEFLIGNNDKIDTDNLLWHKLVNNATSEFFRFGNDELYPIAIKKLAGILKITSEEKEKLANINLSESSKLPIGNSPQMKAIRKKISKIAIHDEPVLILGPSGAGKELLARSVHEGSNRASRPFIPINCATLSQSADMAYDRLFGHIEGAYTGAKGANEGAFEVANTGTLFLDEVAELPIEVQTSLLRVLEDGFITRLGTMETIKVNVRIIAATNQDIPILIKNKKFRLDLFFRLNVLSLTVPPLKERIEDIKSIITNIRHGLRKKGYKLEINGAGWNEINNYDWPGNIRQLQNVLIRAAYLEEPIEHIIQEEIKLGFSIEDTNKPQTSEINVPENIKIFFPTTISEIHSEKEIRKAYAKRVHQLMNGNSSKTAKILKVSRNTLQKRLKCD